ncbi:hypothetical protein [Telluribacter sp. SYSU D00476]|uniref:hypothetical protein n=1 Tax=Telluribacter sp. SYSU D00476 TaxID=2811430 RepID=UPI001FF2A750|nr:hypothetical protein [Telluribacter sp. SYSU D00476]
MKKQNWIKGLASIFFLASLSVACSSETERKGDKVTDAYEDVVEAHQEGDTSEIREEQAKLDSARQEYREMANDPKKDNNNNNRNKNQ